MHVLKFFDPEMNKPNMHNNNTGISSFQASLNDLFS